MKLVLNYANYNKVDPPFDAWSAVMRKLLLPVPEGIMCTKEWESYPSTMLAAISFDQVEKMLDLEK